MVKHMILRYSCSDFASLQFWAVCRQLHLPGETMLFDLPGFKTEVGGDHPETSRSQPWVAGWHEEAFEVLVAVLVVGFLWIFGGHSWFSYFFGGAEYSLLIA